MLLAMKPDRAFVQDKINELHNAEFTYKFVGATYNKKDKEDLLKQEPPANGTNGINHGADSLSKYWVDHYRVELGRGEECYKAAVNAVKAWKMFDVKWAEIKFPETPIEVGAVVGVLAKNMGFWSLNFCKIIYVMDNECEEDANTTRFGFGYGTLQNHVEEGEERFMVEWDRSTDIVWYDLFSFSRPQHWLLKLGGVPVGRYYQRSFAKDSMEAMAAAVRMSAKTI